MAHPQAFGRKFTHQCKRLRNKFVLQTLAVQTLPEIPDTQAQFKIAKTIQGFALPVDLIDEMLVAPAALMNMLPQKPGRTGCCPIQPAIPNILMLGIDTDSSPRAK
jgi:hypothetical protein